MLSRLKRHLSPPKTYDIKNIHDRSGVLKLKNITSMDELNEFDKTILYKLDFMDEFEDITVDFTEFTNLRKVNFGFGFPISELKRLREKYPLIIFASKSEEYLKLLNF